MGKVKDRMSCLGQYHIDTTIAIDAYWDEQANRQQEIEEMEGDVSWFDSTRAQSAGRS